MSEITKPIAKVVKPIANALGFGVPEVPQQIINMPSPQAAADANPLPVMPLPDDQQAMAARRRSIADQRRRRGRASTLLSQETDALG